MPYKFECRLADGRVFPLNGRYGCQDLAWEAAREYAAICERNGEPDVWVRVVKVPLSEVPTTKV